MATVNHFESLRIDGIRQFIDLPTAILETELMRQK